MSELKTVKHVDERGKITYPMARVTRSTGGPALPRNERDGRIKQGALMRMVSGANPGRKGR